MHVEQLAKAETDFDSDSNHENNDHATSLNDNDDGASSRMSDFDDGEFGEGFNPFKRIQCWTLWRNMFFFSFPLKSELLCRFDHYCYLWPGLQILFIDTNIWGYWNIQRFWSTMKRFPYLDQKKNSFSLNPNNFCFVFQQEMDHWKIVRSLTPTMHHLIHHIRPICKRPNNCNWQKPLNQHWISLNRYQILLMYPHLA